MNFKNKCKPTFITEFAANISLNTIFNIVNKRLSNGEWDDTKKLINIYGIAKGMSYLHSLNILHRDLNPGNIFIDEYLFPKIGDFGFSKEIKTRESKNSSTENKQNKSGNLGTLAFMSPEIIFDNSMIEFIKGKKLFQQDDLINSKSKGNNNNNNAEVNDLESSSSEEEDVETKNIQENNENQNQNKKKLKPEDVKIEKENSSELKVQEVENNSIESKSSSKELNEQEDKIIEEPSEL